MPEMKEPNEDMLADDEVKDALRRYRKRKDYMKSYNSRPTVQQHRKEYMKARAKRDRDIIKKAKELGIEP